MVGDSDLSKIFLDAEKRRQEELERHAIVFEFPDWTHTDQEAYDRSLLPKEALSRFPFDTDLAITQLQRELQYDRVQAVCHEAIIFDKEGSYRLPLPIMHSWHWWQQMPRADDDFWQTGYLEIVVPEKFGGLRFESRGRIRYFGVRFWPDGLPGGTDNPLPDASPSCSQEQLPQLSKAEAERVAKALLDYWGTSLSESRAWELAKGMCPEHRVSRDPFLDVFRAIRGPKRPGKPTTREI